MSKQPTQQEKLEIRALLGLDKQPLSRVLDRKIAGVGRDTAKVQADIERLSMERRNITTGKTTSQSVP